MLPATFFVRQDVFITKDTSCQEIRCKEDCKITKKTLIGSTKITERDFTEFGWIKLF
jgi:hypothetical protein